MSNSKAPKKESFEESLEALENLVGQLESGERGLEESLKLFEQGVTLAKTLAKQLEEAKHRVDVLIKEGGKPGKRPLENA